MARAVASAGRVGWLAVSLALLGSEARGASQAGEPGTGPPPGDLAEWEPVWAAAFGGLAHFSEPVLSATMGFEVPTTITEVLVDGGRAVKEGDLLIRGSDAEELAMYETQKLQTMDDLEVQRARKVAELRRIEYENKKEASERGAASPLEVGEARVSMQVAELDVRLAEMAFEQAKLQLDRAKARLDRLRVYAPFDGIIDEVLVGEGDGLSEGQPALRIVNIDSLRTDVPVPTEMTIRLGLERGDPAWVLVGAPGEKHVYLGRVTEVSPRTLYATQQRRVRVEFPNPRGLPSGLPIWVRFTEPEGEWRDRIVGVDEADVPVEAVLSGSER